MRRTFLVVVAAAMMMTSFPALAQEQKDCAQQAEKIQKQMAQEKSEDVAKLLAQTQAAGCLRAAAESSVGFCAALLNYGASHPDLFRTPRLTNAISAPMQECIHT